MIQNRLTFPTGLAALAGFAAIITVAFTSAADLQLRVAAISVAAIVLFATRALPEVVTACATFLAFLSIAAAPTDVIFSGFFSGGFWLLFGGIVIGEAIASTGLGRLVAQHIFSHTGNSYRRAVWLLAAGGVGLGFLVPSAIPRVIVLLPITLALAEAMGFRPGSRGHTGLTITAATTTLMPTYMILTANLPTIVEFGAIDTLYAVQTTYGGYFLQQFPVNALRFVVLMVVLLALGPHDGNERDLSPSQTQAPPNRAQLRLLVLLSIAIVLWATDFWHGIAPAWVAVSVSVIILWPAAGIMKAQAMKTEIDLSVGFFIAGVFCVSAVATYSGLSVALANTLVPMLHLGEGSGLRDLYAITGLSALISHLTTAPATPVVLAPLAQSMAQAAGWPIETVAMAHVVGISTTVLPYQAPPLLIAIALANIPMGALARVCVIVTLAVTIIGLPITYLWWQWLGVL